MNGKLFTISEKIQINGIESEHLVMREEQLFISICGEHYDTVFMTPYNLQDFIKGYLLNKKIVTDTSQILQSRLCDTGRFHVQLSPDIEEEIIKYEGVHNYILSKGGINWGDIRQLKGSDTDTSLLCREAYADELIQKIKPIGKFAGFYQNGILECIVDANESSLMDKLRGAKVNSPVITNISGNCRLAEMLYIMGINKVVLSSPPTSAFIRFAAKGSILYTVSTQS